MRTMALTGGIATGKSTAAEMMREILPDLGFFDSDESVQKLLQAESILAQLSNCFGTSILRSDGKLDRAELRRLIFSHPEERKKLEKILHPEVRKECLEEREKCFKRTRTTLFVADVPLFFESGFDFDQELSLVVATSAETQKKRLRRRNQFDDRMISSILDAQLPIMEKVKRGDVVFWNEGSRDVLKRQLTRFFQPYCIR